jgi:hypothetical protein
MIMIQTFRKAKASCCQIRTNSSIRTEERNGMKLTFKQPHFLLGNSCLWCASDLSLRGTVEICNSWCYIRVQNKTKLTHTEGSSKNNHGNLTLNNFVKATIFVDIIVQIGTLDCINSNALKKSIL